MGVARSVVVRPRLVVVEDSVMLRDARPGDDVVQAVRRAERAEHHVAVVRSRSLA